MRATKGAAPEPQLALPSAPVLDKYGLHAEACECARCHIGYRPTPAERDRARRQWEHMERARAKAASDGLALTKDEERNAMATMRLEEEEKRTIEYLRRLTKPIERPATDEEMDELRRANGLPPRRKDRP